MRYVRHRTQHTAGFTIVELLIVIAVTGLIGAAMVELFISYDSTVTLHRAAIETDTSATMLANELRDMTLQANAIVASHSFSGATLSTGTTSLVLSLPAISSSGSVINGAYDYIGFYASGTTAYRLVDANGSSARASGSKQLSKTLSSMTFSYPAANVTQATSTTFTIITSMTVRGKTAEVQLSESVYLRNI